MKNTWTIASREISVKVKNKTWITIIAIISILGISTSIITGLIINQPQTQDTYLYTQNASSVIKAYQSVPSTNIFTPIQSLSSGLQEVKIGKAKALIEFENNQLKITTKSTFDQFDITTLQAWTSAATRATLSDQIKKLGGDPTKIELEASKVKVSEVSIEQTAVSKNFIGYGTGLAIALIMFFLIFTAGSSIAMGIAEEKESRVVEVMLATVKPSSLMSGKIIGIGVVNILSFLIPVICTMITSLFTGLYKLIPRIDFNTLIWICLIWLIVGYITYSVIFAALGSTASGVIDAKTVITPITLLSVAALYAAIYVPVFLPANSIWIHILALVPVFAPYGAPTIFAMGLIPLWECLLSLGISIICVPIFIIISAKIYKNSILMSGKTRKKKLSLFSKFSIKNS